MNRFYVGIDFSIKSTACTIWDRETDEWKVISFIRDCTKKRKEQLIKSGLHIISKDVYYTASEKDLNKREKGYLLDSKILTDAIVDYFIQNYPNDTIFGLESLSFGSTGSVLAQISGYQYLLRTKLVEIYGYENLQLFAPLSIKKYATGKGNADKTLMVNKFKEIINTQHHKGLEWILQNMEVFETKNIKPFDDITDSYFICKILQTTI